MEARSVEGGRGKGGLYYGWIVAAAAFLVCLTLGESFYAFGVFFKPLENEFGWSRATTSSAYTAFLVGYAVSGFWMGRLADKYGPRLIVMLGGLLCGAGFILAALTTQIWHLQLFLGLAGLGSGATWTVPAATIQRWFIKRRGQVLGMVAVGVGLGALVFVPLINFFVETWGWRTAYVVTGVIYLGLIVIAAAFLVHSPERKGLKPYGAEEVDGVAPAGNLNTSASGLSLVGALRTRAFLALALTFILAQIPTQVMMVHIIPFATDAGIPAALAASAVGLLGAFSIPGRLVGGVACDRIGWSRALGITYLGQAFAALLLVASRSYWALLLFVVFYGMFHGSRNPTQSGIVSYLFGTRSLGGLLGLSLGIGLLAGSMGPYVAGFIFDHTHSYFIAFVMMATLLFLSGAAALFLKPPGPRPEKRASLEAAPGPSAIASSRD